MSMAVVGISLVHHILVGGGAPFGARAGRSPGTALHVLPPRLDVSASPVTANLRHSARIALVDPDMAGVERLRQALSTPLPGQTGHLRLERVHGLDHLVTRQKAGHVRRLGFDAMVVDWRSLIDIGACLPPLPRARGTGRAPALVLLPPQLREHDMRRALKMGAEDYAVSPISALELRWRLGRLLTPPPAMPVRHGAWSLHPATCRVRVDATDDDGGALHEAELTETEFSVFSLLLEGLGRVVTRQQLTAAATLPSMSPDSRALDTHIYRLRRKLPLDGSRGLRLQSVYCKGYQISATTVRQYATA